MFNSYIICTMPRSGSTLLCSLLASTKTTGNPNSFYHRRAFMRAWAAEWNLPQVGTMSKPAYDAAYLAAAITAGTAGTSLFGLRLQREYLDLLSETLDGVFPGLASDAQRFKRAFGRILYIHLTRADKVAQAVSLVRAEQSGLWHVSHDGTELERLAPPQDPHYDFASINREVLAFEAGDRDWKAWFADQNISPLRIDYVELAENPALILINICERLGVEAPDPQSTKPGLAKLSDTINLDWIRRYTEAHHCSKGG